MAKYTQARQPLSVKTPLGPDDLLLEKVSGHEELSRLFRFELDMLAESSTSIAFDKLLGQKITVSLKQASGQTRYLSGIVSEFTQGRRLLAPSGDEFVRYRAVVVPQLWLLTRRFQSRIFQHRSVPDILKQVLQGLDVSFQIQGSFEPRDFCVQYRESDFDFASRLMEEEGIGYFFEHKSDGHTLVLANTPSSHEDVQPSSAYYDDNEGGTRTDDRVFAWEKTQSVRAGKVTLWDYCFELPTQHLAASQVVQESSQVGSVSHNLKAADNSKLEIYDYPGRYAQRFDGIDGGGGDQSGNLQKIFSDNLRTAGIRMQEETATALRVRGQSHCRQFTAGYKFNLDRHPDGKGSYVLTRVEHDASLSGSYAAEEIGTLQYENRFQAIPPDLPFRPERRTPRPTIAGTQTATVVGPSGQDIFLDKYGRVKVQFHWDRQGKNNADSSCWVRVGQLWAGNRWGGFFWPRVGHEVIVAFEEGDPDQPVIVGSVYNAKLMPPFELPGNAMIGGIKSCSFGASADPLANFNGMVFHDEYGKEHVQVHSENHDISSNENYKLTRVGSTCAHVVGAIPGTGSGSGSGSGDDSSGSESPTSVSIFNWPGTSGMGSWGKKLEVTVGINMEACLGLMGDTVVGTYAEVIVNPLGLIGAAGHDPPLGFTAVNGEVVLCIGTASNLVYGPEFNLIRGPKVEGELPWSGYAAAGATFVGLLYTAVATLQGCLGLFSDDDQAGVAVIDMIGAAAAGVALGILVSIESDAVKVASAANKTKEADALTLAIKNQSTPIAEGLVDAATQRIGRAVVEAKNMAFVSGQQAARAAAAAADHHRNFSSDYTVDAYNLTFTASYAPSFGLFDDDAPPASVAINLNAMGVSPAYDNGVLRMQGSQQVTATSGSASLELMAAVAVGNVNLICGAAGKLSLQRTNVPVPPQSIQMTDTGITMQQLPGGIFNFNAGTGTITLQAGAASIILNGETGQITLNGTGIMCDCVEQFTAMVEENSVQIQAQGVNISGLTNQIQSEVQLQTTALSQQVQAQGEFIEEIALGMYGS